MREFTVALPAAQIEEKIANRLKDLSRTARISGFRPGKVPVSLLRKRFGAALRAETLQEMLKETSTSIMSERGLRAANQPKISVTTDEADADFEYKLALEILPDIEAPDYGKITLERLVAEVEPSQIDSVLNRLAEDYKSFQAVENRVAALGDQVVIDFIGRIDGEAFDGGTAEGYDLELGSKRFLPGFEDQLVGSSAGETRTVKVTFPEAYTVDTLAGKDAEFEVSVKEVKEPKPSNVDDDLAKKLGLNDLAALRSMLEESETQRLKAYTRARLKRSLLDILSDMYSFELPPGMVASEYHSIVAQATEEQKGTEGEVGEAASADHDHDHSHAHAHEHDHDHDHAHDHHHDHEGEDASPPVDSTLTEDQKTEYRGLAERRVRLGLVLAEISRQNNLEVTNEELQKAMRAQAARFPGQETLLYEYYKRHPEALNNLAGPVLEDKVVDFLVEMGTVTEKTVSVEELTRDPDEDPGAEQKKDGE
ncbi:MAG: trigger factor [Rhodospirillales bacterium]|nr:trigger factor [Rhodospirillales bacterium]